MNIQYPVQYCVYASTPNRPTLSMSQSRLDVFGGLFDVCLKLMLQQKTDKYSINCNVVEIYRNKSGLIDHF